MYVQYIGKLFLRMLKCIIIPLIIPSLIASVGSLDLSLSGKVGGRAVAYYMVTTVLAVILGIILVSSVSGGNIMAKMAYMLSDAFLHICQIRPGDGPEQEKKDEHKEDGLKRNVTTADTLMDLVRNCFPPNIIQATMQQYRTTLIYPGEEIINKTKEG